MKLHSLCQLFPQINQPELLELAADIKQHGQHDPIILFEGQILDGQNRFAACDLAGIKPQFKDYTGTDALSFVISKNLSRRHLDSSQRAMIAAELASGKWGGNRAKEQVANLQLAPTEMTVEQAAKAMNVGERSVSTARTVKATSTGLAESVKTGKVSLNAAASAAKGTKRQINNALKKGTEAINDLGKQMNKKPPLTRNQQEALRVKAMVEQEALAVAAAKQASESAAVAMADPTPRTPVEKVRACYAKNMAKWNVLPLSIAPREIVNAIVDALESND